MNDKNFTTTFTADATPEEAFAAITNPRGWWSEAIEGSTDKLDDEFTYRNEDVHRCKNEANGSDCWPKSRLACFGQLLQLY